MGSDLDTLVSHLNRSGFLKFAEPTRTPVGSDIKNYMDRNIKYFGTADNTPSIKADPNPPAPRPTFSDAVRDVRGAVKPVLQTARDWLATGVSGAAYGINRAGKALRGGPDSPLAGVLPALLHPMDARYHLTRNRTGIHQEDQRTPGSRNPEIRARQSQALVNQNKDLKNQENIIDTSAGYFMEAENPENQWANYTLPFASLALGGGGGGAGFVPKLRGAWTTAKSLPSKVWTLGNTLVNDTRAAYQLGGMPSAGWHMFRNYGWPLIRTKGNMALKGTAAETAYITGKNLMDPNGMDPDASLIRYAIDGNPVLAPIDEEGVTPGSVMGAVNNGLWYSLPASIKGRRPAYLTTVGTNKVLNHDSGEPTE